MSAIPAPSLLLYRYLKEKRDASEYLSWRHGVVTGMERVGKVIRPNRCKLAIKDVFHAEKYITLLIETKINWMSYFAIDGGILPRILSRPYRAFHDPSIKVNIRLRRKHKVQRAVEHLLRDGINLYSFYLIDSIHIRVICSYGNRFGEI